VPGEIQPVLVGGGSVIPVEEFMQPAVRRRGLQEELLGRQLLLVHLQVLHEEGPNTLGENFAGIREPIVHANSCRTLFPIFHSP